LGVKTTYYTVNGGPTQTGNSVYVAQLPGIYNYTLQFWSEDWSGNVETLNSVDFTVAGGTGTLRLVWGDSDISGSPCDLDPAAEAEWIVRRGTTVVSSGSGACPGWSGVDDVVVQVSLTPYWISIDWWDSEYEYWELTTFTDVEVSNHGQVVRLSY
jgi:hypothetical protein